MRGLRIRRKHRGGPIRESDQATVVNNIFA